MPSWSRSLPVLAVIGTVVTAGCGGGDYPSKPNDICKEAASQFKALKKPKAAADLHVYLIQYTKIVNDEVTKFKTIKPPSDKQAAYRNFLAGLDQVLAVLRRATSASGSNPQRSVALIRRQAGLTQNVAANAKAAGLTRCGGSG